MQGSALSSRGYNVLKAALSDSELTNIKNELTVVPFIPGGGQQQLQQKPTPNKLYMESESRLYVPKFYGLARWGAPSFTTRGKRSP